jgi:hypothetical protein
VNIRQQDVAYKQVSEKKKAFKLLELLNFGEREREKEVDYIFLNQNESNYGTLFFKKPE